MARERGLPPMLRDDHGVWSTSPQITGYELDDFIQVYTATQCKALLNEALRVFKRTVPPEARPYCVGAMKH